MRTTASAIEMMQTIWNGVQMYEHKNHKMTKRTATTTTTTGSIQTENTHIQQKKSTRNVNENVQTNVGFVCDGKGLPRNMQLEMNQFCDLQSALQITNGFISSATQT